jgi:uncharacterized membrane protein
MNIPPIHPALVHLPIAFVILSVIADFSARCVRRESRKATCRAVGFWSLVAALISGILTIAAGYFDMNRANLSAETHELVHTHLTIGWILGISLVVLTAWRWLIWHRGQMTINTSYLVAGSLVLLLTLFQGWFGGEMVYSHGAGVAAAGQGTEPAESAQSRLLAIQNFLQQDTAMGGSDVQESTNQPHHHSHGASPPEKPHSHAE